MLMASTSGVGGDDCCCRGRFRGSRRARSNCGSAQFHCPDWHFTRVGQLRKDARGSCSRDGRPVEPPVSTAATDTDCCAMFVHQQTRRGSLSGLGSRHSGAIRPLPDNHATCGGWNILGRGAGSRAVPSQSATEPTQHQTRYALYLENRCEQKKLPQLTCCDKVDSTQMRRRTERVERSSWRNSLLSAGRRLATTRRHGPSATSAPDHPPTWPEKYCSANECRQAQFAHTITRGCPRGSPQRVARFVTGV